MVEEPLFPMVGTARRVWNFLKSNPYKFYTVGEIAQNIGLKKESVQTGLTLVTFDPRVVRRKRVLKNGNFTEEYGFVPVLGNPPEGGDEKCR